MPTESAHPSTHTPALLLFGAGGHARVVADALLRTPGTWRLQASDRNDALCVGELLPGVPLTPMGALGHWPQALHVAIGDNAAREKESLALGPDQLVSVLHPLACVSPHAQIAAGCFVAAQAVLAPGAVLAMGVIVNHAAVVDHDVTIGAFAHIAPGAVLGGGVRVGARVLLGAGAVVRPGVSICDGAVIGAGAVVCADILQAGVYVGVPARRMG